MKKIETRSPNALSTGPARFFPPLCFFLLAGSDVVGRRFFSLSLPHLSLSGRRTAVGETTNLLGWRDLVDTSCLLHGTRSHGGWDEQGNRQKWKMERTPPERSSRGGRPDSAKGSVCGRGFRESSDSGAPVPKPMEISSVAKATPRQASPAARGSTLSGARERWRCSSALFFFLFSPFFTFLYNRICSFEDGAYTKEASVSVNGTFN